MNGELAVSRCGKLIESAVSPPTERSQHGLQFTSASSNQAPGFEGYIKTAVMQQMSNDLKKYASSPAPIVPGVVRHDLDTTAL